MAEPARPQAAQAPPGRPIRFELTWDRATGADETPVDLDIGCFYWSTDGQRGAVQAVGGRSGNPAPPPGPGGRDAIGLSADRTDGGADGERLTVHRPGRVSFLVVHASIYDGATDFRDLGAAVTVRSGRARLIDVTLSAPAPGLDWCAALVVGRAGSRLHVVREERYFRSAFHADRHYGLGLDWGVGHKPA